MKQRPFVSYAQNFEDVMLHRALRHVTKGFYIDIGADHPTDLSVTKAFYERHWRGINVEPLASSHAHFVRERPGDVPLLVRHFVQQLGRRMKKRVETIPAETMAALVRYDWPGNVRELQNLVERAMILSEGPVLRVPLGGLEPHGVPGGRKGRTLQEAERAHILEILAETKWVLAGPNGASARLGMNRSTLQFRMKKLGIVRPGR